MKAWEIIGYVDFDALVHLCDECGDDNLHTPVFASGSEDLEDGEVCDKCGAVWRNEQFEWLLDDPPTAVERLREAIDAGEGG